jgi:hypothetical protein
MNILSILESLFKKFLYLIRCQRRKVSVKRVDLSEAKQSQDNHLLESSFRRSLAGNKSLNDTKQDSLWTTQKQNFYIAGCPSNLYLENNMRRNNKHEK